jgi:DeoR family transcriptional regulator, fructose operon transcriptional repressor
MLVQERRQSILSLIEQYGSARTIELARIFKVSDQTIRRDLLELEGMGLISKSHGGGTLVNWRGATYRERTQAHAQEKSAIAEQAISLVKPGMTVLLGPGTTTGTIAQRLDGLPITLVTNSLAVAQAISQPDTEVRLTGGQYRPSAELVVGDWTERNLDSLFADLSFIGVSGVDEDAGYTVTQSDEAMTLRQFIRVAKRSVVVTDSSKFLRVAKASVAPLDAVHLLITDCGLARDARALLTRHGVEVITVGGGRATASREDS